MDDRSNELDWDGMLRWIDDRMLYIEDFTNVIRFMIIVFNVIPAFIFMLIVLDPGSLVNGRSFTYVRRLAFPG